MFIPAYRALDSCLERHRYAPRRIDTGAYACRRITGGSGYSLHAYGPGDRFTFWNGLTIATALAVDINWQTNPYSTRLITDMPAAMIADIRALITNSGHRLWGWGGDYRSIKDAMHFEVVCTPAQLATGIRPQYTPEQLEEMELMAAKDDILRVIAALQRDIKNDTNQIDARLDRLGSGLVERIEDCKRDTRERVDLARDQVLNEIRKP